MICPKCNSNNPDNSSFCSSCGNSLNIQTNNSNVVTNPTPVPVTTTTKEKKGFNYLYIIIILCLVVIALMLGLLIKNHGSSPIQKKDNTRTIMIYMVGSNLESESGIASAEIDAIDPSKVDLSSTNVLIYTGGTEKWHNFVSNTENAIYKLTESGFEKVQTYEKKNMGDPTTFTEFLTYSYENYPAGHFNLIMYDHGGAIDGAIYDDFTNDNLSIEDLKTALKNSPFNSNNKMDAVFFRTCLNGTLEISKLFVDYSEYIIFSEEITNGHSRSNVLGYFINSVTPSMDAIETGKAFINAYIKQMEEIDPLSMNPITYSIIDLSKIDNIINEFESYISSIDVKKSYSSLSKIRKSAYQYGSAVTDYYDMIDLYNFVKNTRDEASYNPDKLLKYLDEAIVYNYTTLDSSYGLSIYFPYGGKTNEQDYFLKIYSKLGFLESYKTFITSYSNMQSGSTKFSYDFTENKTEKDNNNEISIELTDDELNNYVDSQYIIFRRNEEHPDFYQFVYSSNDATLNGNKLSTNFNNKLIKLIDKSDGDYIYLYIKNYIKDNYQSITTTGIIYDNSKSFTDKEYSSAATLLIKDENGKPIFGGAKKITRDERLEGVLFDLSSFDTLEHYKSEYKILDANGNMMDQEDWERIPVLTGLGGKFEDFELEYAGVDDGEFYCLFVIYDINNNAYYSSFIKVG